LNLTSNQDQAEISTSNSCVDKPFIVSWLHECEKLSEDFKPHSRTFPRPKRQSAVVPNFAPPVNEGALAKQTKITIETDSLLILHGRSSLRAWCSACAAEVESIDMEHTGVISNLDQPALEEWLNSKELHRLETPDGSAQICLNSLVAMVQKTKPN
jgi:hypothetical protein